MTRAGLKLFLYPLALVYGIVIRIRNYLFDHGILRSEGFAVPIISVGNITVGGTGKTPHVEYLVQLLIKHFNVAVLSRGYMRETRGFRIATADSLSREIGDEPLQIKLKYPGITVAVDADRRNGIKKILENFPDTDVIILDDGFQHRWVTPGLSILLTDYSGLFTRDHLLPYGRLREHRYNYSRADIIIVTKAPRGLSAIDRRLIAGEIKPGDHQKLYFTSIDYSELRNIHSDDAAGISMPEIGEMGCNVLLITGIANPLHLKSYIEDFTRSVSTIRFGDHHIFTTDDIDSIKNKFLTLPPENSCIITTEKDCVRLREFKELRNKFDDNFYYLPISVNMKDEDQARFNNHIIEYVRKNRTNSIIPEGKRDK